MDLTCRYLTLPRDFAEWLGSPRWSATDDALVYPDGTTCAFSEEMALFVEGFAGVRPLIQFGYLVYLLRLMVPGRQQTGPLNLSGIQQAFRDSGGTIRNAGAFAAALCSAIPPRPDDIAAGEVCRRLRDRTMPMRWFVSHYQDPLGRAEHPPIEPDVFGKMLDKALASFGLHELKHWFRHGRGPILGAAATVVDQLPSSPPRDVPGWMSELFKRPRLAGAGPHFDHIASALALPPRRLERQSVPVGGYVDLSVHGQPDDILPSQFVLDDLEFDRRYAENELLYFRREEPVVTVESELIILLDQGVRTWGDVRLVLCAAALALGKLGRRRTPRLFFACTSVPGRLFDPLQTDAETLGELLESSDLSADPGLALESLLEKGSGDAVRDIVILTHRRSLDELDVRAAAKRLRSTDRLFAVALNDRGQGELHELKHGSPIRLREFRVKMDQASHAPPLAHGEDAENRPWRGDIEPISFPFRFGTIGPIGPDLFDFDDSGKWLLTATVHGTLHAWRVDGSDMEILPRGMINGSVLLQVKAVVGVAGGFAVVGTVNRQLIVAYYALAQRSCVVYQLGQHKRQKPWVTYHREYDCLAVADGAGAYVVDLGTSDQYPPPASQAHANSGARALAVHEMITTSKSRKNLSLWLPIMPQSHIARDQKEWFLYHVASTGQIVMSNGDGPIESFVPQANGRPALTQCKVVACQCENQTIALLTEDRCSASMIGARPHRTLRLFARPGTSLAEYVATSAAYAFILSRDGRWLARHLDSHQIEVRDVYGSGPPSLITIKWSHPGIDVQLNDDCVLLLIGKRIHIISYERGPLDIQTTSLKTAPQKLRPGSNFNPSDHSGKKTWRPYHGKGFMVVRQKKLIAAVDIHGQVLILDPRGEIVCMFFVYRDLVAGWMPDGTRLGPAHLTGAAEHPEARARFAMALRKAAEMPEPLESHP